MSVRHKTAPEAAGEAMPNTALDNYSASGQEQKWVKYLILAMA